MRPEFLPPFRWRSVQEAVTHGANQQCTVSRLTGCSGPRAYNILLMQPGLTYMELFSSGRAGGRAQHRSTTQRRRVEILSHENNAVYLDLLYGIVSPKHLRKGQGVPNEDADELIPAVHPAALVQAPLARTHNTAVDSKHHPPVRVSFVHGSIFRIRRCEGGGVFIHTACMTTLKSDARDVFDWKN